MRYILLVAFAIFFGLSTAFSQNLDEYEQKQFKLGESYEQNGNAQAASEIFAELFLNNQNNQDLFDAYIRVNIFLHKYSEIIASAESFTERNPSAKNYATTAAIHWKLGNIKDAERLWQKAIDKFPKDPNTYIIIANEQIMQRQYENAINTMLKGRNNLDNESIFADYLSRFYSFTGNYKDGFKEVMLLANDQSQNGLAKGRLYAYIENDAAKGFIKTEFESFIKNEPNNYIYLEMYAWFLRLTKDYESAFDIYVKIDEFQKAAGREIYNFGYNSLQDGQYRPAEKAFNYIIEKLKNSPYRVNSFMGLAQALDEQIKSNDSVQPAVYKEIINQYDKIVAQFPNTPQADEAQYRAAVLIFEKLKDIDKAIERFNFQRTSNRNYDFKIKSAIMLGNIYLAKEDASKAKEYFKEVVKARNCQTEDRDIAKYSVAEIEYFYGNLDSAKVMFEDITKNSESIRANDALKRLGLIEANKNQIDAFTKFRLAELKEKINEPNIAADLYIQAANSSFEDFFSEQAYIKAADIYYSLKDKINAKKTFELILSKYEKGLFTDYVYLRLGDIAKESNSDTEAINNYTKILNDFPKSIYLQEAREKARELRDKIKS